LLLAQFNTEARRLYLLPEFLFPRHCKYIDRRFCKCKDIYDGG
jgi:hypothetical protein